MLPTVATDPQSVKREQKAVPRYPPAHPAERWPEFKAEDSEASN